MKRVNESIFINKMFDRRNAVVLFIVILFGILLFRLGEITLIEGDEYRKKADESFIKLITSSAKRGDIYDRNNKLLASSQPSYSVDYIDFSKDAESLEEVSIKILTLLEDNGETYIDFPIVYNGRFTYKSDNQINDWLNRNNFEANTTAKEVFDATRLAYHIDTDLDRYTAQSIVLNNGVYLPISIKSMRFLKDIEKDSFLEYYGLSSTLTASEAFDQLKKKNSIGPSKQYDVTDTLRIMSVKHAINLTGYYSYKPIVIAQNISKETNTVIQEKLYEYPGISITVNPIRFYPFKESAAHIIGYIGKISSTIEVEKYLNKLDYYKSDLIGKTGIEKTFEETLHGVEGMQYVYANARGQYIGDFIDGVDQKENVNSSAGSDVHLSIDIKLQQKVESLLKYTLEQIREGGSYDSKWGNMNYDSFENARTGAVMVVDVTTGEVLAMVNEPSYDPNLFSTGISFNNWQSLQADNSKDPLAARPLYNIATRASVQPGSVFKPITVLAALEKGLSIDKKMYSDGYIEIGKQLFRCWYYKEFGKKHGYLTALEALMVSSNYIMFDLISGYDFYKEESLNIDMGPDILMDYAERFGLGLPTGLEIYETNNGLPSEALKIKSIKRGLKTFLKINIDDYTIVNIEVNDVLKDDFITTVVGWTDDYLVNSLSRNKIISMLNGYDYMIDPDKIESLADSILYSYFRQLKWRLGDHFNLSIGQGDHRYTVAQISRYISAIANGGYLNELTLIKQDPSNVTLANKITLVNEANLLAVKEGMKMVANDSKGSLYTTFNNFPIVTAGKTGTAQKSGQIPEIDEVNYLILNLENILMDVNRRSTEEKLKISVSDLQVQTEIILIERSKEITELTKEIDKEVNYEVIKTLKKQLDTLTQTDYLHKGSAMRAALLQLAEGYMVNEDIDKYKSKYAPFAWIGSFAPYDDPEIAIVIMIPQGGHSYYAAPLARDIYDYYFDVSH